MTYSPQPGVWFTKQAINSLDVRPLHEGKLPLRYSGSHAKLAAVLETVGIPHVREAIRANVLWSSLDSVGEQDEYVSKTLSAVMDTYFACLDIVTREVAKDSGWRTKYAPVPWQSQIRPTPKQFAEQQLLWLHHQLSLLDAWYAASVENKTNTHPKVVTVHLSDDRKVLLDVVRSTLADIVAYMRGALDFEAISQSLLRLSASMKELGGSQSEHYVNGAYTCFDFDTPRDMFAGVQYLVSYALQLVYVESEVTDTETHEKTTKTPLRHAFMRMPGEEENHENDVTWSLCVDKKSDGTVDRVYAQRQGIYVWVEGYVFVYIVQDEYMEAERKNSPDRVEHPHGFPMSDVCIWYVDVYTPDGQRVELGKLIIQESREGYENFEWRIIQKCDRYEKTSVR